MMLQPSPRCTTYSVGMLVAVPVAVGSGVSVGDGVAVGEGVAVAVCVGVAVSAGVVGSVLVGSLAASSPGIKTRSPTRKTSL